MSHPFILNGLMLLRKLRLTKLAMKARTARAAGAQASDRRRWLKRLDRYIIKKFLGTYLFSIVLLLAIVVVFDVNEKLDAMMKAPLYDTIFVYFWNFLPYFANQFSPLFTFIAVIFFTSKMADHSEIIAILSSGVSFRRLMRPYMLSAAVIAAFTFVLSAYVIPPANVKRIAYTNEWVKNKKVDYGFNIQLQVEPGVVAHINSFDARHKRGKGFTLDRFDNRQLKSRLSAENVRYDTLYHWIIEDYTIRDFKGLREHITRGKKIDSIIPFEPRDFLIASNDQETLTTPELRRYIARQRERGVANIASFEIELHRRYAATVAAFILTIIGMTLSAHKRRGGTGVNIGIGLVLSFSYILFTTVTASFAVSGVTSPMVAEWIPNIVFSIIAIVLYRRAAV